MSVPKDKKDERAGDSGNRRCKRREDKWIYPDDLIPKPRVMSADQLFFGTIETSNN